MKTPNAEKLTSNPPVMKTIESYSRPRAPHQESKPWQAYITLDTILLVLSRSIFHPFVCFLIPLCLRAQLTPYTHPSFILSVAWAVLVTISHILAIFNHRIAYGRPREVDLEEEVVVITGGCSGLGRLIAEIYGMRGVSVAVLDIKEPEKGAEDEEGWTWYKCDVGKRKEGERVKGKIEADVCTLDPTCLHSFRTMDKHSKRQSIRTTLSIT